jgi:pimeloyl-ACP methyl ester carboxylesterase
MPSATINGTAIYYEEQGKGKPVVLLHGFPLSSHIWAHQLDNLSQNFRVITPDFRGFGQSPPAGAFTVASLADDVYALLQSIDALPCALGGLSMGGYVALAFAKKYPQALSALMLVDTRSEGDSAEGKAGRQKMIDLVRASGSKAVADQMLPKMLTKQSMEKNVSLVRDVRAIMEGCPAQTIEHALVALRDREDYSAILPSIATPTLILVGDQDPITPPAMSESLHKSIPRSQLQLVPGAAHLSSMEKPELVTEAMRSFLSPVVV